jgi:hypothetical protein
MREAEVLSATLYALSHLQTPDGRRACPLVWRETVGAFRALRGEAVVRVGVEGMPDVLAVLCTGRAAAFECKSSIGRLREAQRCFREVWQTAGGLWVLVRDPAEATAAVLEALA